MRKFMEEMNYPIDVKAELDGYYVKNLNFWLDVKCFFCTIISVLKAEGVIEGGTGNLIKRDASAKGTSAK